RDLLGWAGRSIRAPRSTKDAKHPAFLVFCPCLPGGFVFQGAQALLAHPSQGCLTFHL
ncbi:unnamed protein product, partial [Coccothraustes coccothraustes]